MQAPAPLPPFAAIVVAAGQGLRAGQPLPKQFANWRGKPLVRHSVERLKSAGASHIVVVIPENAEDAARTALGAVAQQCRFVVGGQTRQESVRQGLEALSPLPIEHVLIHDAARPDITMDVVHRLVEALSTHAGAIPVLPVVDSLVVATDGLMAGTSDRNILRRAQTPQAFRFANILAAHRAWTGQPTAGDDAQVLAASDDSVALVVGDDRMRKMTFAEDFMEGLPSVRVGQGFDVHRLVSGEDLWLCGIKIDHDKGLAGHSDADVALHAVVDALLGAIGNGDIGSHFPPSDEKWRGASSSRFVEHAASLVLNAGYRVGNVDLTIICEAPKIGPHRDAMREKLAQLMGCDVSQVSVKATTTERLGFTGRGEGIAAQAIATVLTR